MNHCWKTQEDWAVLHLKLTLGDNFRTSHPDVIVLAEAMENREFIGSVRMRKQNFDSLEESESGLSNAAPNKTGKVWQAYLKDPVGGREHAKSAFENITGRQT